MNYEFNFDHSKRDFVEALGIERDKIDFFKHKLKDVLIRIDKEDNNLSKSEVIENVLTGIPGNVSPIELFYLGFIISNTNGFKKNSEEARDRLKELAKEVRDLEKDGLNPEEAIETVLEELLNLGKLEKHVLNSENDF